MVSCPQEQEFYYADHPCHLSEYLAMAQPFGGKQQSAAAKCNKYIYLRRSGDGIKKVGGKKDCNSNLVCRPDQNGKIQDPVGAVTDSAHPFAAFTTVSCLILHCSPQKLSLPLLL